jgi:hypothetical protein
VATRFYLRATSEVTAIAPTPDSGWEDVTILARAYTRTTKTADTLATVNFADANNAARDILFRQYISFPLTVGQTITGAQALKAQCRCQERIAGDNMFFTIGIRVIAGDGSTVRKTVLALTADGTDRKTVLALTADGTEISDSSLQNRQFTATSAATNFTTVIGDRLVFEIGTGGDPANTGGADHDTDLRLGDSSASDLSEDDTSTTDNNPWIELTDTLTFTDDSPVELRNSTRTVMLNMRIG